MCILMLNKKFHFTRSMMNQDRGSQFTVVGKDKLGCMKLTSDLVFRHSFLQT